MLKFKKTAPVVPPVIEPTPSIDPILNTNLEILINLRNKWLMEEPRTIEQRRNIMALNIVIINTERLIDPA
jgi:hypothetical protein